MSTVLIHANDYDAVVSATEKQTHDVRERFHPESKLFTIPVGVIPDEQFARPRVAMADRQPAKVLVTARVAPEKRIDHIIEAIGIAKKMSLTFHLMSMVTLTIVTMMKQ